MKPYPIQSNPGQVEWIKPVTCHSASIAVSNSGVATERKCVKASAGTATSRPHATCFGRPTQRALGKEYARSRRRNAPHVVVLPMPETLQIVAAASFETGEVGCTTRQAEAILRAFLSRRGDATFSMRPPLPSRPVARRRGAAQSSPSPGARSAWGIKAQKKQARGDRKQKARKGNHGESIPPAGSLNPHLYLAPAQKAITRRRERLHR